ncbi:UNVERIFIED_ORG: hypothetical protein JN05_01284 [Zoogloea ramigera]|uniref:Head-tail adaptor protein n=1 Tax=Duganella zoogloeoides TaxID=75659 RepID=A0ABZ0Y6G0_9BURK|nr:hypothetical protein [Duganella zoogloeoides]WQH06890.1 hypothetical protein SR858_11330 [Duganella zoogloeoides]
MTDYAKKARETDGKLRKKGGTVTLRRIVLGDDDPDTGKPEQTITDFAAAGVKFGYVAERIDGKLIQSGDQELLLSPLQLTGQPLPEPSTGDLVLINGARFAIHNVAKLEPTDVVILYTLQLRGN